MYPVSPVSRLGFMYFNPDCNLYAASFITTFSPFSSIDVISVCCSFKFVCLKPKLVAWTALPPRLNFCLTTLFVKTLLIMFSTWEDETPLSKACKNSFLTIVNASSTLIEAPRFVIMSLTKVMNLALSSPYKTLLSSFNDSVIFVASINNIVSRITWPEVPLKFFETSIVPTICIFICLVASFPLSMWFGFSTWIPKLSVLNSITLSCIGSAPTSSLYPRNPLKEESKAIMSALLVFNSSAFSNNKGLSAISVLNKGIIEHFTCSKTWIPNSWSKRLPL